MEGLSKEMFNYIIHAHRKTLIPTPIILDEETIPNFPTKISLPNF